MELFLSATLTRLFLPMHAHRTYPMVPFLAHTILHGMLLPVLPSQLVMPVFPQHLILRTCRGRRCITLLSMVTPFSNRYTTRYTNWPKGRLPAILSSKLVKQEGGILPCSHANIVKRPLPGRTISPVGLASTIIFDSNLPIKMQIIGMRTWESKSTTLCVARNLAHRLGQSATRALVPSAREPQVPETPSHLDET
jgi:hypothetical protein